jgi:hypothetical protein
MLYALCGLRTHGMLPAVWAVCLAHCTGWTAKQWHVCEQQCCYTLINQSLSSLAAAMLGQCQPAACVCILRCAIQAVMCLSHLALRKGGAVCYAGQLWQRIGC